MKKILVLFIIFFSLMIISGCGGSEDCSIKDSTYEKFSWDDDEGECVSEMIPRDECGNGIAEDGESFCSCPKDVQETHPEYGCFGEKGDYLEQSCNDAQECVLRQNEKVVEETKTVELRNTDLIFDAVFGYNKPFVLNTEDKNKFVSDISFLKVSSSSKKVKDLLVKELRIEDSSGKILGSAIYNEKLAAVGDELSRKLIAFKDTDKYESKVSLRANLLVSYTLESYNTKGEVSKSEEKIETLKGSLGSIEFLNPIFYED